MASFAEENQVLKRNVKLLYLYDITTIILLISLAVFTGFLYQDLNTYRNNELFQLTEVDKIELFRDELNNENELLWKYANIKQGEEVYFYLKHNQSKKNILEVFVILYKNNRIISNEYLFDVTIK